MFSSDQSTAASQINFGIHAFSGTQKHLFRRVARVEHEGFIAYETPDWCQGQEIECPRDKGVGRIHPTKGRSETRKRDLQTFRTNLAGLRWKDKVMETDPIFVRLETDTFCIFDRELLSVEVNPASTARCESIVAS